MMVINNKFDNGDIVYHKTDPDQQARIVTVVHIYPGGNYGYSTNLGEHITEFYECELSSEVNYELKTR